jgi:hypothetical protein
MSKIICLSSKTGNKLPFTHHDIERVFSRLTPDNITPTAPLIIEDRGILVGIFNPVNSLPVKGCSVCLGAFFDRLENWWEPASKVPDGSYALFRADEQTLELVTDIVASRTIWYVQTQDLFIASTSQRAIVSFLQSFEANEATIPWMLSSGTLGPGFAWDRRINCLHGDSCLRLDRRSWKIKIIRTPVVYSPLKLPVQEHEQRLFKAMDKTFEYVDPHAGKWVLPLSGGFDSRAILLMMNNRSGLKSVTWGLKAALNNRQSDAWVARELAKRVGIEHEYLETDLADEPVEQIFKRFLMAGEGRIDHVSGYMDGFAIWKWLFEKGYQGIIRGDEAFGCRAVKNDQQVCRNMNLTILSDYENIKTVNLGFDIKNQKRPETFEKNKNETRDQWRDRVNAEFEIPFMFAALSDLKLSYVEIVQPLLSRRIVEQVRLLPDELRTEKSLFKKLINRMTPKLEFAKYPAIGSRADILQDKPVVDLLCKRLRQFNNKPEYLRILSSLSLDKLERANKAGKKSHRGHTYERINRWLKKISGGNDHQPCMMDPYTLSFRVFVIAEMADILYRDAEVLKR